MCNKLFSLESFNNSYIELQQYSHYLFDRFGKSVLNNINVVFWAKDGNGTPCLVEGCYNYWAGDQELTLLDIFNGFKPEKFLSRLQDYYLRTLGENEEEYNDGDYTEDSFLEYGWEYSTVEQGNLFYGRANYVEGSVFGEVIGVRFSCDVKECGGLEESEYINKEGLEKLAESIKNKTVEKPRW